MICRSVKDGMAPGAIAGFNCKVCGKAVGLTIDGQKQLAVVGREHMLFLCNPCGLDLMAKRVEATRSEPELRTVLQINPEATEGMERVTGKSALDLFPTAEVNFDPLGIFRRK
jgi:hypothetical protein